MCSRKCVCVCVHVSWLGGQRATLWSQSLHSPLGFKDWIYYPLFAESSLQPKYSLIYGVCVCVYVWLPGGKCPCVYFRVEVRGQLLRVGSFLHVVASEFEHRLLDLFRYLSWLSLPSYHLFKFNSHWISRSLVNFLSSYFGNSSHGGFFAFIYI